MDSEGLAGYSVTIGINLIWILIAWFVPGSIWFFAIIGLSTVIISSIFIGGVVGEKMGERKALDKEMAQSNGNFETRFDPFDQLLNVLNEEHLASVNKIMAQIEEDNARVSYNRALFEEYRNTTLSIIKVRSIKEFPIVGDSDLEFFLDEGYDGKFSVSVIEKNGSIAHIASESSEKVMNKWQPHSRISLDAAEKFPPSLLKRSFVDFIQREEGLGYHGLVGSDSSD